MGFFDDNTYSAFLSKDDSLAEKSSLTYDYDEDYFYAMSDARVIRRLDRDGNQVGSDISFPVGDDTEGICYLGANFYTGEGNFAVLEEGEGASPHDKPRLYIFQMDANTTSLDAGDITTYDCPAIETFPGTGAEGIAYDPSAQRFYVGVQAIGENEGGLWEVLLGASAPTTFSTRLFYWYDKLVSPGEIPSTAFVGDLERNGAVASSIFVLVNDVSDAAGQKLIEMDLSGNVLSVLQHALAGKTEGVAFEAPSTDKELFLVGEQADPNWWRFTTRTQVTLLDWKTSGRYDDSDTDYATSSPRFSDPSFDPDSPPGAGAAFKTGAGSWYYGGISNLHGDTALTTLVASSLLSYYVILDLVVAKDMEQVLLEFNSDDGFLLLVDDVVEYAYNYSSGLSHSAASDSAVGGSDEGDKHGPFALDASKFTAGAHRIAILVKNQATSSSDIGFDLRITGFEKAGEKTGTVAAGGGAGAAITLQVQRRALVAAGAALGGAVATEVSRTGTVAAGAQAGAQTAVEVSREATVAAGAQAGAQTAVEVSREATVAAGAAGGGAVIAEVARVLAVAAGASAGGAVVSQVSREGTVAAGAGAGGAATTVLLKTGTVGLSSGALLLRARSDTLTSGALLSRDASQTLDSGALLSRDRSSTLDSGALLSRVVSAALTSGALLSRDASQTLDSGALLSRDRSSTLDSGTLLQRVLSKALTSGALVQRTGSATLTSGVTLIGVGIFARVEVDFRLAQRAEVDFRLAKTPRADFNVTRRFELDWEL